MNSGPLGSRPIDTTTAAVAKLPQDVPPEVRGLIQRVRDFKAAEQWQVRRTSRAGPWPHGQYGSRHSSLHNRSNSSVSRMPPFYIATGSQP